MYLPTSLVKVDTDEDATFNREDPQPQPHPP